MRSLTYIKTLFVMVMILGALAFGGWIMHQAGYRHGAQECAAGYAEGLAECHALPQISSSVDPIPLGRPGPDPDDMPTRIYDGPPAIMIGETGCVVACVEPAAPDEACIVCCKERRR